MSQSSPGIHSYPPRPRPVAAAQGRTRIASQATPLRTTKGGPPRLNHAGRERAITLGVTGQSSEVQAGGWDPSEPVVREMQKSLLGGAEKSVQRLGELNRQIRQLCDVASEFVGTRKQLPKAQLARNASEAGPVGKAASEFTSSEEFAFFTLLSVINKHVFESIFRPFHPCATDADNDSCSREYKSKINTESQLVAGAWRSKMFRELDNKATTPKSKLLDVIIGRIRAQYVVSLRALTPPGECLPPNFALLLREVLDAAFEWNRFAKTEIVKYDLEPFTVEARSPWDLERMESFERLSHPVPPNRLIISPVSFGLLGSVALVGRQVSYVQQKAQVLVEEWFRDSRGRTFSVAPPVPATIRQSHPRAPSSSQDNASPSNGMATSFSSQYISQQAQPTRGMSADAAQLRQGTAGSTPAATKKGGGFLCC